MHEQLGVTQAQWDAIFTMGWGTALEDVQKEIEVGNASGDDNLQAYIADGIKGTKKDAAWMKKRVKDELRLQAARRNAGLA